MNPILIFALAGLATYLLRSTLVMADGLVAVGGPVEKRLGFVGPAVLAAFVASALFTTSSGPTRGSAAEVLAVGAAMVAVARTGNVGLALVAGLPVYWAAFAVGLG